MVDFLYQIRNHYHMYNIHSFTYPAPRCPTRATLVPA